jgi:hypothetical protein
MGHDSTFLTVDAIAFGVDQLLEFVADRTAMESSRPPTPTCGGRANHFVVAKRFDDGATFELRICSKPPPASGGARIVNPVIQKLLEEATAPSPKLLSKMNDLEIDMVWHFAEPTPPELLFPSGDGPNPELEKFFQDSQSWILRVSVCELCYPWINAKRDPEFRKIRSTLDQYAQPRLILPESDAGSFRGDFIALIAMFAAKAQCLGPKDNELPKFFRSYCDQLFDGKKKRRQFSEAEWHGVIDAVFRRLYRGTAGMGFTMPVLAPSFRFYVAKSIRYQLYTATSRIRLIPKPGRFPASIGDAATKLGVSHMTVRRFMKRLGFKQWDEKTWTTVSAEIMLKKRWQELAKDLQRSGSKEDAARKRVLRCKLGGLPLNEARRRTLPKGRKGTCTSCGDEQVLGEVFEGRFLCSTCYAEKTGFSPDYTD